MTAIPFVLAGAGDRDLDQVAIDRAVAETGCSPALARQALEVLRGPVEECRRNQYRIPVHMSTEVLTSRAYLEVIARIMGHGAHATDGSAHEAFQDALLDRSRGEGELIHDRHGRGELVYCGFTISVCRPD